MNPVFELCIWILVIASWLVASIGIGIKAYEITDNIAVYVITSVFFILLPVAIGSLFVL